MAKEDLILKSIRVLIKNSKELTAESHPDIHALFQNICKKIELTSPPQLRVYKFTPFCGAITQKNTIILGNNFHKLSSPVQEFTLTHELGHILREDIGDSRRAIEHATDRLAVQILGSRDAAVAFSDYAEQLAQDNHHSFFSKDSLLGRLANKLVEFGQAKEQQLKYGTFEERRQNILDTDPHDKSHVKKLISEYHDRIHEH